MAGYELKQANGVLDTHEKSDASVDEEDVQIRTTKATWRHWMIGLIGFLTFSGMNIGLFVVSQYIYRRLQVEAYPNKTFETGISYCSLNASDPDAQELANVQQKASSINILFVIIAGIPSIFFNIVMGSFTDRFGRKFLMLMSISGSFIRIVVSIVGVYVNMNIYLFAIGFAIEGATGQIFSFILASYAYVSDITTRKNRAIGIVFNEVSLGLAVTLSTFTAGYFLQASGFEYPLILAACLLVLAMLITIFILPESYVKENRKKSTSNCMNLRQAVEFYYASWNYGFRWKYMAAIFVFYFSMVNVLGRLSVETLYQLNAPFCWTPEKLGIFGAVRPLLQQTFGMLSVGVLKRFLEDESIAIVGTISMAASFVIEGLAKTDEVIYIVTVVGALGMLAVPMIRSIMSKMTSPDRQGALAAGISFVETTCHLTSTVMLNAIYQATVVTLGGAVFFVMAAFTCISLILLIVLKFGSRVGEDNSVPRKSSVRPISYYEKEKF